MTTPSDQTPAGVAEETQPAHETRGSIDLAIDAMRGDPESANYARLYRIERYIDALQSRLTAAEERERKLVEALREALGASVLAKDEILRAALLAGSKG